MESKSSIRYCIDKLVLIEWNDTDRSEESSIDAALFQEIAVKPGAYVHGSSYSSIGVLGSSVFETSS
jgi:hypothetical protein